jgi:hypothetical protein
MTKNELRQSYVDAGWTVQAVAQWLLVSEVGGKRKYDVNAVSPENKFGTAQVVVDDDNGAGETAVAQGFWVDQGETFSQAVRDYARTLEGGSVFAITVEDISEQDEVAEALAYMDDGSKVRYAAKRRGGTFSVVELI